jgi:hypothetical protein
MTTTPLPLTAPPRLMARQPSPRPGEDHQTHLSGGARYASAKQMRPAQSAAWRATERGRPASVKSGPPSRHPVQP